MLLQELRSRVLCANREIVRQGLVLYTFGNVSGIDRNRGIVAIKPSGVAYDSMKAADIVLTDLDGKVIDGSLHPSSDLATHLALYRAFPEVGGIAHTHSEYATAWAQAAKPIPCYGTTHADYFHGSVPVTEPLNTDEVETDYVRNTGEAIVRRFHDLDPLRVPAVLVAGHAPFCWGETVEDAVLHAVVLEYIARLALHTVAAAGAACPEISQHLLDRHHNRKHGAEATYGQVNSETK